MPCGTPAPPCWRKLSPRPSSPRGACQASIWTTSLCRGATTASRSEGRWWPRLPTDAWLNCSRHWTRSTPPCSIGGFQWAHGRARASLGAAPGPAATRSRQAAGGLSGPTNGAGMRYSTPALRCRLAASTRAQFELARRPRARPSSMSVSRWQSAAVRAYDAMAMRLHVASIGLAWHADGGPAYRAAK